jgi:hypothetical protein
MDATSMSLYWVARLPIKRPKGRTSVFAEAGVPARDADAAVHVSYEDEAAPAVEATFPGTTANGKVRISSKTSPAARIGRLRQWKIALSLAVVGALAAPFAFRTYKAYPLYSVRVPFTAQDKEEYAKKLENYFLTRGKRCEDMVFPALPPWAIPIDDIDEEYCYHLRAELERGTTEELRPDRSKYWVMNVGAAAVSAVSLFGLAYLIPMLIRGVVFLTRRYWRWLSA